MLLACGGAKIDNDDAEDDEDAEDDGDAKTMMTRIWAVAAASGNSHRAGPTELAVAATSGNSHRAWSAECRWQQRVPTSKGFRLPRECLKQGWKRHSKVEMVSPPWVSALTSRTSSQVRVCVIFWLIEFLSDWHCERVGQGRGFRMFVSFWLIEFPSGWHCGRVGQDRKFRIFVLFWLIEFPSGWH